MEKDFEILEHTADVGIAAYGADIGETFANAGRGLFSLITELESIDEVDTREIEAGAGDREGLLVAWLNELIYLFDAENVLFKRFEISELDEVHIRATGYGEQVNSSKHEIKLGVKAASYHMLKIEQNKGFRAQVIFDI
jgi:SHS2 domain-containing protein